MNYTLSDLLLETNIRTKKNDEYPVLTSSKNGIIFTNRLFQKAGGKAKIIPVIKL